MMDPMTNVRRLFPAPIDIRAPAPLRDLPFWCLWRHETHAGELKARKVPYWADGNRRHGVQGSPLDRSRLVTFTAARDAAVRKGFDGVGFAHLDGANIITLDFDNCVVDGKVRDDVFELIGTTYAEYSPSGRGIHAIFSGPPDLLANQKTTAVADGGFTVEAFSSKGFTTFSGWMLDHVEILGYEDRIAPIPQKVVDACRARFGRPDRSVVTDDFMAGREPPLGLTVSEMQTLLSYLDPSMGREPWLRVGMALHHETQGDDTGLDLWDSWSSEGTQYQGTDDLLYQWERFEQRVGRRSVTMASVIAMAKQEGYDPRNTSMPEELVAKANETVSRGRFRPRPISDFEHERPVEWLIKGMLPKGEFGVLFGPSGGGKTFVGLDLAFSIARGCKWRGCRVRQGRVVIVAAEGGGGIAERLKAYVKHHGLELRDVPELLVVNATPNLLQGEDITELIADIKAVGPVDLVQIDTLAQVSVGANENTSEDMGRVLSNLRALHIATGAMVLAVHHAGKDPSKGSRGWSGIKAAADVQLEIVRKQDGPRLVRVEKMKDGADGGEFWFELAMVDLGLDADGDPRTSCVVIPAEPAASTKLRAAGPRGATQKKILAAAVKCGADGLAGASLDEVITQTVNLIPYDPQSTGTKSSRDQRRSNVRRALEKLCEQGFLVNDGERIYVPDAALRRVDK